MSRSEIDQAQEVLEQSMLGAALQDPDSAVAAAQEHGVSAQVFTMPENATIWGALVALNGRAEPIDEVTVFQMLHAIGAAERCGGLAYLNALSNCVPSARNVGHYAAQLAQRDRRRRDETALLALARQAADPLMTAEQYAARKTEALAYVSSAPSRSASTPTDPLAALRQFLVTCEQVEAMQQTRLLCGGLIGQGHLAVICAPAGAGKTQMAKFVAMRLAPEFKVLFFQEDASAGDLPALHEHAQAHGYSLMNSTLAGSSPDKQLEVLEGLVKDAVDLNNFVLIFDTLKKFCDLMSKGGSRGFFRLMRALTLRGATVILLGHVNKHKSADGKPLFEGVGDVRNDVDELIYLESTPRADDGTVTMTMRPDKARCAIKEATFVLDTHTMIVRQADRVVDVNGMLQAQRQRAAAETVVASICKTLAGGGLGFEALRRAVMADTGEGRNRVGQVIEAYCSDEPSDTHALWLQTRIAKNNTRYISLKPGGAQ